MRTEQLNARLRTVLTRVHKGERLYPCTCENNEDCIPCGGTGWITRNETVSPITHPTEVLVSEQALNEIHKALHARNLGHLGNYGFLDMFIQPYSGMYSNPYPLGELFGVRLRKAKFYNQAKADAIALASCEAAYLAAPDDCEPQEAN